MLAIVVVNQSIMEWPPLQDNRLSTRPASFRNTLRQGPRAIPNAREIGIGFCYNGQTGQHVMKYLCADVDTGSNGPNRLALRSGRVQDRTYREPSGSILGLSRARETHVMIADIAWTKTKLRTSKLRIASGFRISIHPSRKDRIGPDVARVDSLVTIPATLAMMRTRAHECTG